MLLVLKRGPEQETALQKLLDDQQDKSSPRYRQWLTPEQFGQQFGPADSDIQQVTDWLQAHGFQNVHVSNGRVMIEFSGTTAQVESALGTSVRKFAINGEEHWANASDPTVPAAISPVVEGVFTLHNFYKHPQLQRTTDAITARVQPGARPQFTSLTGLHALVPADYYTIYNFNPLQINTVARIAIVGRSNINGQDVIDFHQVTADRGFPPTVIVNGPDPGILAGGEEIEAVLDTTWAGAVAPTAWVGLVVSQSTPTTDGVDLSELYIIDNNLADVMSESFGSCEANFTSTQAMGIASLAQQAAAQGITYVVAAGDSGAAGCDDPNTKTLANGPASVNMLASNPHVVAVGGTMFNENGHASTYWNSSDDPTTLASALSYIPENVWNESCASGQTGCTKSNIWAGGGGASTFFPKPSWQTGVSGIPTPNARNVPDVSLTSAAHDPYLLCIHRSCVPNAQGQISFIGVGGTSAAAPAFAGIMALVGQKNVVRLGQPNYVLYRLAAAENLSQCNASGTTSLPLNTCVFNDVTVGSNSVPGEPNYGTPSAKYQAGNGYDLATGLGSVNVTALMNQWNSVTFSPTTTNFSISPVTGTHGDPLNVTVSVTPNSGPVKPTGSVWLLQNGHPTGPANLLGSNMADIFTLDAQATFSGVTNLLPAGSYQVNAHYAGDGTYAGSDSSPLVQVNIQPESTTTTFSALTMDATGTFVPFHRRAIW
jgi:subtilase family serine protease